MTNVPAEPTWDRPNRGPMSGFWVAGAAAVVGVAAALVWIVVAALSDVGSPEELARGDLPGSVTTHVEEPQSVVVYYEGDPVPGLDRLDLRVTGPEGDLVPVTPYLLDLEYDSPATPGVVGRAVAGFDAKRAGSYRVDSPYIAVGEARLAVGEDVGTGFVHTLVGPTALAVASLLLASGIAVLTAVRINRRYRRRS